MNRTAPRGWDALPGTLKWVVGLSWFHFLVSLALGLSLVSPIAWVSVAALTSAALWAVVAIGLVRGSVWAWLLAFVLAVLGAIGSLVQRQVAVSTQLIVLVLLLMPSSRSFWDTRSPVPASPVSCTACGATLAPHRPDCVECGHVH